ncbi:unnamed protein product [Prunus armeniaca]
MRPRKYHNNSPYDETHPATYGVCQHASYSYDKCDLNFGPGYILTSPHTIISPLICRDAPDHVWGLSTRRLLLRHVRPQHNLPSYDGTHPASYRVCQHAGYSYDMCDLNLGPGYILTSPYTIISPLIRRDAPGLVWGLSTRRLLLRHMRPQPWAWLHSHQPVHNHISPHTTGCTWPCIGSVNTPATPTTRATSTLGLATFSPARTQSYLPSYDGMHPALYGVCQHAGYSYDTCDLNTITYNYPYDGMHPALYGVCQHAGYSYDTCDLNTITYNYPYDGTHPASYGVCQHAGRYIG